MEKLWRFVEAHFECGKLPTSLASVFSSKIMLVTGHSKFGGRLSGVNIRIRLARKDIYPNFLK